LKRLPPRATAGRISRGKTTFFTKFWCERIIVGAREIVSEKILKSIKPVKMIKANSIFESTSPTGHLALKTTPKTKV
jgi:hypothetical protein